MVKKRLVCVLGLFFTLFICYAQQQIWDEDFSSNKNGWFTDASAIYLEKGMYVLNARNNNAASWRTTAIKDYKITVETKWLGGRDDMGAGLIFRFQNDQQFYIFWIAAQGYYIVAKIDGNNITRFVNWTQSAAINKKSTNTLTVELKGDSISCYANDTKLLATNDHSYPAGGFGFYCQKGVLAGFDNLKVWEYTETGTQVSSKKQVWKQVEIKKWELGMNEKYEKLTYSGKPGNITIEYLYNHPDRDRAGYQINWQWNDPPEFIEPGSYPEINAVGKLLKSERKDAYGWFIADVSSTFDHNPGIGGDVYLGANELSMTGKGSSFKWLPYPKGRIKARKGKKGEQIAIRIGFLTGASEYCSYYYIYEWIE